MNWDDPDHRKLIMEGLSAVAKKANLEKAKKEKTLIIFDRLHKYSKWKIFLKVFFDVYEHACQIVVTGSARKKNVK